MRAMTGARNSMVSMARSRTWNAPTPDSDGGFGFGPRTSDVGRRISDSDLGLALRDARPGLSDCGENRESYCLSLLVPRRDLLPDGPSPPPLRSAEGIRQQARDGHRPDASRNRGYGSRALLRFL